MKIIAKIASIAAVAAVMVVVASCSDFLDQESQTRMKEEQALSRIESVVPMVDGLYRGYRDSRISRQGLVIALGLDESQQGYFQLQTPTQSGYDKYNMQLTPTSAYLTNVWASRFPYQVTAGKIISALNKLEQTEQIRELLGVSHFFRAMGMFELSMFFGKVPIMDFDKYPQIKRRPLEDVWTYIIEDFTKAAEYLPVNQEQPKEVTKGAALAMLGKAYMSAPVETQLRDFKKAQTAFEDLMKLNKYELVDDYAMLFLNDQTPDIWRQNTKESIFELQFSVIWGDGDCNVWQWDTGSRLVSDNFTQGCYYAGWDFLVPTPWMYSKRDPSLNPTLPASNLTVGVWEADDPRYDIVIRTDFTNPFTGAKPDPGKIAWRGKDGVDGNVLDETHPHIRKFEDVRTDEHVGDIKNMFHSGKNHPLIRLADIYLLYAECLHRNIATGYDGKSKDDYVQLVRDRAWRSGKNANAPTTALPMPEILPQQRGIAGAPESADADDFIRRLMDERARELAFEGWRRIDLLRTGLFRELVSKHNVWANREWNGGLIPEHTVRYPIPQDEMLTNPDFSPEDQNPGY